MIRILFFFTSIFIFSQNPHSNFSVPSPNVIGLGKYIETPITFHNGTVGVDIPIYELKEGDITVPIMLSYHSDGARPDVHPGWVGMNWNLKAGGMITRRVKGLPDELFWKNNFLFMDSYFTQKNQLFYVGNFYNDILNSSDWSSIQNILNNAKKGTYINSYFQEAEPDEFIFNFNGYAGSFYMDKDKKIKVIGNPSIKVEMNKAIRTPYNHFILRDNHFSFPYTYYKRGVIGNIDAFVGVEDIHISGFKITTPDGFIYEFGIRESENQTDSSPIEGSTDFFSQIFAGEDWNTWYLRSITSPLGNSILFNYISTNENSPIVHFNRVIAYDKAYGSKKESGIFGIFGPVSASSTNFSEYLTGKIIFPTYLKSIETSSKKIVFSISNTQELSYYYPAILGELFKQARFSYDRNIIDFKSPRIFAQTSINDPLGSCFSVNNYTECIDFTRFQWKKLDSISIIDRISNNLVKTISFNYSHDNSKRLVLNKIKDIKEGSLGYSFIYDSTPLAPYLSYETDHWGFYNGKIPKISLDESDMENFKNYKEPDFNYAKAGVLKKVFYPTGGYTEFEYEGNIVDKIVVRNEDTGNFYLKNEHRNIGGIRIKKIKNITTNGEENIKEYKYYDGIASGIPKYFWKGYKGVLTTGAEYTSDRFVSESIIPLSTNNLGSHVGYGKVEEIVEGKGKTEYYYSNYEILDDNFISSLDMKKSILSPFSSRSKERGLLKEKRILEKNTSGTFSLLKRYIYSYNNLNTDDYIPSINMGSINVLGGQTIYGSAYKVYNSAVLLNKNIEYEHGHIFAENSYKYNKNNFLNQKIEKHPSFTNISNYFYANDKNNNYLINKNIVGIPLETTVTQDGKIISKTETIYPTSQAEANTKTQGLPLPVSSLSYDLENPTKTNQNITYTQYDNKGNLLEYKLNGITPVVIIWGYHQTLPIAKIEGATYDQVKNLVSDIISKSNEDKDEVSEKNLITALDNFRNKEELKNFQITTYTHNPLIGVTSITPPSGIREIYKYDDANRLKQVLDIHGNILKEYNYHYAGAENEGTGTPSEYKNTALSRKFTKNNCTEKDYVGTEYTYNVPSGKYVSTISQADANQKAFDEIDANGQNEANRQGTCYKVYYNNEKRKVFSKKDCPSGNNSTAYTYIVPAKKYLSKISQDDADQKAEEEIKNRGQKLADQRLRCIPSQCAVTPIENPNFIIDKNAKISIKDGKVLISPPAKIKNEIDYGLGINTTLIGIIEDKCIPDTMLSHSYKPFEQERHITINPNGEIFLSENPLFWSGPVLEPDEPIIELIPANKN